MNRITGSICPTICAVTTSSSGAARRSDSSKRSLHTGARIARQIEQAHADLVYARHRSTARRRPRSRARSCRSRSSSANDAAPAAASAPSARSRRTSGSARAPAAISWLSENASRSSCGVLLARNGSTPTRRRLRLAPAGCGLAARLPASARGSAVATSPSPRGPKTCGSPHTAHASRATARRRAPSLSASRQRAYSRSACARSPMSASARIRMRDAPSCVGSNTIRRRAMSARSLASACCGSLACLSSASSSARSCSVKRVRSLSSHWSNDALTPSSSSSSSPLQSDARSLRGELL